MVLIRSYRLKPKNVFPSHIDAGPSGIVRLNNKNARMILLAYYCGAVPAIAWLLVPVLVLYMSLEGMESGSTIERCCQS